MIANPWILMLGFGCIPGYFLVNLDLFRFGPISLEVYLFTRNEAQEQHSLLDTIFDYIFDFGPPGKYQYKIKTTYYTAGGFACRHLVGSGDLSIDIFLEVQNQRYSWILYLHKYIAYGLHLWFKIWMFKEMCRKFISQHPGLATTYIYIYI